MDINEIKTALREGVVTIDFTKVNGDRRRMVATWQEGVAPAAGSEHVANRDPNLLVVWDTEHAGWRTIKVDSIRGASRGTEAPAEETAPVTIVGAWAPNTQVPTQSS